MLFAVVSAGLYSALATAVVLIHAVFILWVIFGALLARSRPWLRNAHIACLGYGVLIEILPWPCPLTFLENWLEQRAGIEPYQGSFLLHYLDKFVYPDVPQTLLTIGAVIVLLLNLAVYSWHWRRATHASE